MLSTAIPFVSHVLLTHFYDNCDGFHAEKRAPEHLTHKFSILGHSCISHERNVCDQRVLTGFSAQSVMVRHIFAALYVRQVCTGCTRRH